MPRCSMVSTGQKQFLVIYSRDYDLYPLRKIQQDSNDLLSIKTLSFFFFHVRVKNLVFLEGRGCQEISILRR